MKIFIPIFAFLLSFNLQAFDPEAFKDVYPDFKNYQSLLLNDVKSYFDSIHENSVIYSDINGNKTFVVKKTSGEFLGKINCRIIRIKSYNQISERVVYALRNGNKFEYEVLRKGDNLEFNSDEDLLSFKIEPKEEEEYKFIIPSMNIEASYTLTSEQSDQSFFSIGFMEFNVKIETFSTPKESTRNYIYFFKAIKPSPQASLTVRAIESASIWSGTTYHHSASNGGEITPKQFFGGLADGAGAFGEASTIIINHIQSLGFPNFQN